MIQRVAIFAGSQPGRRPEYECAARALGEALVDRGLGLVYAGAESGLMAVVAKTVRARGGEVWGVHAHLGRPCGGQQGPATQLYRVGSPRERTELLSELADGIVALPGGLGTFDELFTLLNGSQASADAKPIGLLNTGGYFAPLLLLLAQACQEGFIASERMRCMRSGQDAPTLLDALFATATDMLADYKEVVS